MNVVTSIHTYIYIYSFKRPCITVSFDDYVGLTDSIQSIYYHNIVPYVMLTVIFCFIKIYVSVSFYSFYDTEFVISVLLNMLSRGDTFAIYMYNMYLYLFLLIYFFFLFYKYVHMCSLVRSSETLYPVSYGLPLQNKV